MLTDIFIRIKLLFQKDKELYYDLKNIIGFFPRNIELYKQALLHKSIMHRNSKGKPVNNERLEFLGDAVLGSVVGDIVYHHFPGKREGFLTNTRSKLVQREMLGKLAKEMGITKLVLTSGNSQSHNSYLGGNAFEALVGAIYIDKGYDACMKFIKKRILKKLINIDKVAYKEVNFKSKLLEWSQKNRILLTYELVSENKDENGSPIFSYKVILENVEGLTGKGFTKKEAQQLASKLTLEKLRKNSKFIDSVFTAKSERTKMEEEPVLNVPDISEIPKENKEETIKKTRKPRKSKVSTEENNENDIVKHQSNTEEDDDGLFDLSYISVREKSRDEIIEAAETAAFKEN